MRADLRKHSTSRDLCHSRMPYPAATGVSKGDRQEDTSLGVAAVPGHGLFDSMWRVVLRDGPFRGSHAPRAWPWSWATRGRRSSLGAVASVWLKCLAVSQQDAAALVCAPAWSVPPR